MVPIDYYPNRMMKKEENEWLLLSAVEANFNLLRIWGGGMYLEDEFYDRAAELGLLIWQDFMFSCKFYPMMDEKFIENSVQEVKE